MKNNVIYLIIFIILLAIAGWLLTERKSDKAGGLEGKERYSFTIQDTGAISKIIIRDKKPSEITLNRQNGKWVVNGKYDARPDAIETLLETLYRMEMRNFVPSRMQETVNTRMAVHGKEVTIFKNGEPFKIFYVGTETHDEMATYMMLKGSDQPFAVHIPGFNGFLSSRFFTEEHLWRNRDILALNPMNIKSVTMEYPDTLESSFKLNMFSPDSAFIESISDGKVYGKLNKANVNLFLSAFKRLSYEGFILDTDPIVQKRDSLLNSQPVFKMKLVDTDGRSTTLSGYRIRAKTEYFDPNVKIPEYDVDRMHGFINGEQMVLLQYYGLRHILKPKSHFLQ